MNSKKNVKKELKNLKKELEFCNAQYDLILTQIKELEKIKMKNKYKDLAIQLIMLKKRRDALKSKYTRLYQSDCCHPLWYFLDNITESQDGKQKWLCKCVRCGISKTGGLKDFDNRLIIDNDSIGFVKRCVSNYNDVRKQYLELKSTHQNDKKVVKLLTKKYNN